MEHGVKSPGSVQYGFDRKCRCIHNYYENEGGRTLMGPASSVMMLL